MVVSPRSKRSLKAPALPHQLYALTRAMGDDQIRYLLADEVGLGKTIEAGLIFRELKLRGLVKRVLVVAPKGLVTQWVLEMQTHFGEEFRLLTPSEFGLWRNVTGADNIWRQFDQVVCPVDAIKPVEKRRGWLPDDFDAAVGHEQHPSHRFSLGAASGSSASDGHHCDR